MVEGIKKFRDALYVKSALNETVRLYLDSTLSDKHNGLTDRLATDSGINNTRFLFLNYERHMRVAAKILDFPEEDISKMVNPNLEYKEVKSLYHKFNELLVREYILLH